jgi:enoyl-CoA hydratase/carnithine racemase
LQGWGVVGWVTDNGQTSAEALRLAQRLGDMAANAIASGKELVQQATSHSLRQQLDAERDHFVENLFHDNAAEGLLAFAEKRAPRFR